MGVIGASGLIYRDFLQYILPTIIGLSLFAPLLTAPGASLDFEKLLLLGFVLGYLIFSPVASLAAWVQGWLPLRPRLARRLRKERAWWAGNWDYDQLWAAMDKDEREYLYATASYIHLFRIASLYLLIYALANIFLLTRAARAFTPSPGLASLLSQIAGVQTPMLGDWQAPTWLVAPVALVLCVYLYLNALEETEILFGERGFYPQFSDKYQRKVGGIASGVWGWLARGDGTRLPDIPVQLLRSDGSQIASERSGEHGEFQFKSAFKECLGQSVRVQVDHPDWKAKKELSFVENSVPQVQLVASPRK